MILNINSYAGGADLWGGNEQSFSDGKLEVVGVSGTFQLGAGAIGLATGTRIAQGSELALEFIGDHCIYYQLDGEPSPEPLKTPAVVRIRKLGQSMFYVPLK
jgi:hypothetical protein